VQDKVIDLLNSSTERLHSFNAASSKRYNKVHMEMVRNTELLKSVKTDLVDVLTRVSTLKRKLKAKYPEEFQD
jgi:hypothetical protein